MELTAIVLLLILLTLAAVAVIVARPSVSRDSGGKILAFFALFILPAAAALSGGFHHLERSKQTEFCLSCHTMSEHGRSLLIDDPSFLPATHYVPGCGCADYLGRNPPLPVLPTSGSSTFPVVAG